jgi:MmyB-like transcription regulator ligand binding domain
VGDALLDGRAQHRHGGRAVTRACGARSWPCSPVSRSTTTTARYPDDPDLAALVRDLRRIGAFATVWDRQPVTEHEQSRKTVVHPEVGEIDIDCDVLATQHSDLRVVVFTPRPGTDARGRLDLLAAVGTQTLSG